MLERFGETGDPVIAERTAKACLLAPLSEPDRDAARLLAERAVTMARDRRHQVLPWALLAEALADYRGRRFEATIARADECLSLGPGPWNRDVPAHLVRAMANYRLGRIEVALAALERGAEVLRTQSPSLDGRDLATNWHDVLICEVLRGEAETLVRPPELPADPFAP
jgi:tetratricopeptide (TPR) repeat protein